MFFHLNTARPEVCLFDYPESGTLRCVIRQAGGTLKTEVKVCLDMCSVGQVCNGELPVCLGVRGGSRMSQRGF